MNYIVYKTTNKINGKIYVGVHRTNPDIFDGYIGCGVSKKDKKKNKKGFPEVSGEETAILEDYCMNPEVYLIPIKSENTDMRISPEKLYSYIQIQKKE